MVLELSRAKNSPRDGSWAGFEGRERLCLIPMPSSIQFRERTKKKERRSFHSLPLFFPPAAAQFDARAELLIVPGAPPAGPKPGPEGARTGRRASRRVFFSFFFFSRVKKKAFLTLVQSRRQPFLSSSSLKKSRSSGAKMSKKAYLLLYNSAQLACWSWALAATVLSLNKGPAAVYESAAPAVRTSFF